jgi:transcriptional regulator with XRE-family HTH domain
MGYFILGGKQEGTIMSAIDRKLGQRIKGLREETGFSQDKLAELLGLLRPTISQIELGKRKVSAEELVKLSKIFNLPVEAMLDLRKEPEVVLREARKRKELKPPIRINVPQRNLEKFKEVLIYILNKVGAKPNVGETVIYKLLYFIDFDYYEKYEEQLVGATYLKNRFGPTPAEFKKIIDQMKGKEIEKVESSYFAHPQTKYLPLRKPDLSKLKASEIEVIDSVLSRLSDMNATQISEYSHNDIPWLTTEEGKVIEYETVFYRIPPYSVREYPNELS